MRRMMRNNGRGRRPASLERVAELLREAGWTVLPPESVKDAGACNYVALSEQYVCSCYSRETLTPTILRNVVYRKRTK